MTLTESWQKDKAHFLDKKIHQIINWAGDGKLKDGNITSVEFREFLSNIKIESLEEYARQCIEESFTDSGIALQDILNEIGRRLGFEIEHGRYRGVRNEIGFDGLWKLQSGQSIVVEVKTTDAYRIQLDTIANYRNQLIQKEIISAENSSVLIIVGRDDTGELEAQIRGSKHAWSIRLISVNSLISLMNLKHKADNPQIIQQMHDILIPREYTKLDKIIEILFSTASDVIEGVEDDEEEIKDEVTPKFTPVSFHDDCIDLIESRMQVSLVKKTRTKYTSLIGENYVCCVSRVHDKGNQINYWFAFHPHQKEFLEDSDNSIVAFGCGNSKNIAVIPSSFFLKYLVELNTTKKDNKFYWHVHIAEKENKYWLLRKKGQSDIDISEYFHPRRVG
ncbi:MAG: hypothetical protein P9L94_07595 [Candidatus Hinthialibacter antarcticus]|nr:hypothetical protein [Candidatus Hinthialibacter antarcticus]